MTEGGPDTFVQPRVVAFGECDPAGIAYFPRILDWFHQAMEAWFGALGVPYADVIRGREIGFPAASTSARFLAPCRLGDPLVVELAVTRLGQRSATLGYVVRGADGVVRATGETAIVAVDLHPASGRHLRPVPIPEDLRSGMHRFLHPR